VAVPEFVTLPGVIAAQERLVGTVPVRATVPVKLLIPGRAVTVIVDIPATPTLTVSTGALATTVKSWIVNVTVAACDRVPLVPVNVTM
jgi:hypothetical protein